MIEVVDLWKRYGRSAVLRGLSFEAGRGHITLLVGPNGAGKTTTLKILAGLTSADKGEAWIEGCRVGKHRNAVQAKVGFLPQRPDFNPTLSSQQLLRFYARLRGVGRERIDEVIAMTGLGEVADLPTRALSGGTRQRLGLALLFLPENPVLILDEPGLSLDPDWRYRLKELLIDEARRGKTVLVATHLLGEWEGNAHRCLLCRDGRVERELDPASLQREFHGTSSRSGSSAWLSMRCA